MNLIFMVVINTLNADQYSQTSLEQSERTIVRLLRQNKILFCHGELVEWSKTHAWKVCKGVTLSRVQIPYSPPYLKNNIIEALIANSIIGKGILNSSQN